jgi:flagellar basal body rod protein FlgB
MTEEELEQALTMARKRLEYIRDEIKNYVRSQNIANPWTTEQKRRQLEIEDSAGKKLAIIVHELSLGDVRKR